MPRICIYLLLLLLSGFPALAQKIDSIYFHLYTDSLKKGTYNYINVDGLCADGSWLPLTSRELRFTASSGKFNGNSLFVDSSFAGERITVRASLIKAPFSSREMDIYIKKNDSFEKLKTMEEVMNQPAKASGKTENKRKNR